jgi:isoleucyl-tRNA synthetase
VNADGADPVFPHVADGDAPGTSAARLEQGDGDAVSVAVTPSTHAKCERCWHLRADVGADPAHPALCGRCVSNLFGAGEPREIA